MATNTPAEWARICRTQSWLAADRQTRDLFRELAAEFELLVRRDEARPDEAGSVPDGLSKASE
jgi:hypothetical protein